MTLPSSIVVLGSINTDLVVRTLRLPRPGETVLGGEFYQAGGGKGANQAVAAARASRDPVTFIGAVGKDRLGQEARDHLAHERLRCKLKVVPQQPSGVALILVDEHGQNAISVAPGANLHLLPEDVDALPDGVFAGARVFLTVLETPLQTVARALHRAKQAGLTTILNPAPANPAVADRRFLELVDVLTPNQREAIQLAGLEGDDRADPREALARLQRIGCGDVVVTLGEHGCLIGQNNGEVTTIPAVAARAVDTTGAGDAFNGALAVALAEGHSLPAAARWANHAAALSVARRGAQPSLPTRAEIGELQSLAP